jgi:hypothetical protein
MLLPRFTIRTALAVVTGCAFLFLIVGMAYRGQMWAWGISIGAVSLLLTALVHAAWFGVVWLFAQMPSGQQTSLSLEANLSHPGPPDEHSLPVDGPHAGPTGFSSSS